MTVLQKLKIELLCDQAIPIAGIYPKEINQNFKELFTPILIAMLFTIAKILKESKCLTVDEWIKKMWGICTHVKKYIYI